MYTVVYKLRNQYWIVHYVHGISENLSSIDQYEAVIFGTEIARWGDD